jgi:hypothetical protein
MRKQATLSQTSLCCLVATPCKCFQVILVLRLHFTVLLQYILVQRNALQCKHAIHRIAFAAAYQCRDI